MAIQYGVAVPQMFHDGPVDMGLVRSYAGRAEELGYQSLWVQEQIIGATPALEPLTLLSYLAGVTQKIRLGAAVIVLTTRNPVVLAKELGSIDHMSEGRLIVGVALGGRPRQYPLLGGPAGRRVRHFEESLAVMKALWVQARTSFDGDFWKLDGEAMEPRPVQKPHPPIWFGGRHDAGLRRAARLADGWMGAGSTTTADFKRHVGVIREALESLGRDPSEFPISKRVYIALDDDEARAERRLREWFGQRYGNADMGSQVSVWGSAERCAEGLQEILDGGAGMLMLNPMFDHMEHLEALHGEVMPKVGGR